MAGPEYGEACAHAPIKSITSQDAQVSEAPQMLLLSSDVEGQVADPLLAAQGHSIEAVHGNPDVHLSPTPMMAGNVDHMRSGRTEDYPSTMGQLAAAGTTSTVDRWVDQGPKNDPWNAFAPLHAASTSSIAALDKKTLDGRLHRRSSKASPNMRGETPLSSDSPSDVGSVSSHHRSRGDAVAFAGRFAGPPVPWITEHPDGEEVVVDQFGDLSVYWAPMNWGGQTAGPVSDEFDGLSDHPSMAVTATPTDEQGETVGGSYAKTRWLGETASEGPMNPAHRY